MKVLLVATMYNEGLKSHGFAYEYFNLFQSLKRLVDTVIVFDFMEILQQLGRERMNQALLDTVRHEHPEVTIVVPYTDQLIPEVVDEINLYTVTIGYFFDDVWRIEYSRFWAGHFSYITSSDINCIQKYHDSGYNDVIYSPFACNHCVFVKKDLPKLYDVSFVGQYHPYRAWYILCLKRAGISVHVWGNGWRTNRLHQDEMVNVFNQSRINLNLSNCISWDMRYLLTFDRPIVDTLRAWRGSFRAACNPDSKVREMVKGRHFEINACGGFQLSYYVEGLERHYRIGDEIALYASTEELVEKVRYYLKHEDEREAIALQGYERTMREHNMERRFRELFEKIGFTIAAQ